MFEDVRDPVRESNCAYEYIQEHMVRSFYCGASTSTIKRRHHALLIHVPSILCSTARAPVAQLVRTSDWDSEDPGSQLLAESHCLCFIYIPQNKH